MTASAPSLARRTPPLTGASSITIPLAASLVAGEPIFQSSLSEYDLFDYIGVRKRKEDHLGPGSQSSQRRHWLRGRITQTRQGLRIYVVDQKFVPSLQEVATHWFAYVPDPHEAQDGLHTRTPLLTGR